MLFLITEKIFSSVSGSSANSHTCVYLLVKKGASILAISKRLGHASIQITADTYSELFEDVDQDLAKKLDELELTVLESSVARSNENIIG